MNQFSLLREVTQLGPEHKGLTIQERFEAFRELNPHIEELLTREAHRALGQGWSRIGIDFLYHRLRWVYAVQTERDPGDFRLNDHYTSRYARLLIRKHPEFGGLFETRRLRAP